MKDDAKKYDEREMSVRELVNAFNARSLLANIEYQRGASWNSRQKAAFVDSVFRGYPIPALFIQKKFSPGLEGEDTPRYEVVDGQQRLAALKDYAADNLRALKVDDLSIPSSLRKQEAPWAGKFHRELDDESRSFFESRKLRVFMLNDKVPSDEVRDLFIRLQSGTALSRQQIRDAWPGKLSEYVVQLAGKIQKQPQVELFKLLDMRTRDVDEDDTDTFVPSRQLCAQLLSTFLARRRNSNFPSLSASSLDALYHEHTEFDPKNEEALDFEKALRAAHETLRKIQVFRIADGEKKNTFTRAQIIAVFVYFVDHLNLEGIDERRTIERLARDVNQEFAAFRFKGRMQSKALETWYSEWKESMRSAALIVDPKRGWTEAEVQEIAARDEGICHRCNKPVASDVQEVDHHPIAHVEGGRSIVANGRLVHRACNRPGRPRNS